ncbi:MAG: P1 family peptidase [Actinomycetota bacterium]
MITDVEGIRVGHWTDAEGITGCTVVLPPEGTVGSCEWRGGAPGDREWVMLQPEQRVDRVHAVVLSGGSAYGLATADGVMRWLEERGIGWDVAGLVRVPVVPAAILFDLALGDPRARPGAEEGRLACERAQGGPFETGSVGAGTGCSAGKLRGALWATKSGIGSASVREGDLVVGAIAAVNPVGDVLDEQGRVLAGSRAPAGTPMVVLSPVQNTLLGVVATNARLTKADAFQVARAGQDGVARVVAPAHTRYDGDVVFSLGTCRVAAPLDQICLLASEAIARAIRQAVRSARGLGGLPGLADGDGVP